MANDAQDMAKKLKHSATYLERIPFVGGFFKKARENVEKGAGPHASDAQMSPFASASKALNPGKKKRASDELK